MPKYKSALSMVTILLLAGTASATFEIKDPAAEIYENTPEKISESLAQKACVDFLLEGAQDPKEYKADLDRVRDYVLGSGASGGSIPAEEKLREFCIDNPKKNLREAVDTLVPATPNP
jgi:hypothetical protein